MVRIPKGSLLPRKYVERGESSLSNEPSTERFAFSKFLPRILVFQMADEEVPARDEGDQEELCITPIGGGAEVGRSCIHMG